MIKAVIFDMDGLMIDSERVTYECFIKVLKKYNLSITLDFYKKSLGTTIDVGKQIYMNEYGNDFPFDQILDEVHFIMNQEFETHGVPLKPGLKELLQFLKDNQYKAIVATSSQRQRVNHILSLSNLTSYFDDSICGDEVKNGKPNPEIFLKACQKLNVLPSEVLVLEDSEAGIKAAYDGHIQVICIPDLKHPSNPYDTMPSHIFNTLHDVISFLKKQ